MSPIIFKGYDLIYSEDDGGWYAQDFSTLAQPVSIAYPSLNELKAAINAGTLVFPNSGDVKEAIK